jgi:hypothetical protein
MSMKEDTQKLEDKELEDEANRIKTQYYELLKKRKDVFRTKDLGCHCDGKCRDYRPNVSINAGTQHSYCHDDADWADVSVTCLEGNITVVLSAAVWSSWNEQDRRTLKTDQGWYTQILEQDDWFDQSNRVQIFANEHSRYDLIFQSYD